MGKVFQKQTNTTEDREKKQVYILKTLQIKELEPIEGKSDDNGEHLKYKVQILHQLILLTLDVQYIFLMK